MNRSLLYSFVELLKILIEAPTAKLKETQEISLFKTHTTETEKLAWDLKCQQIQLLLFNMSYILNSYRPHQVSEKISWLTIVNLGKRSNHYNTKSTIKT